MRYKSLLGLCLLAASFCFSGARADRVNRVHTDLAYDAAQKQYVRVFEQQKDGVSTVWAELLDETGDVKLAPKLISTARDTQGYFFGSATFDKFYGTGISQPSYKDCYGLLQQGQSVNSSACPQAKNPSVAYHAGQFMVVWELHGTAPAAYDYDPVSKQVFDNSQGKDFSVVLGALLNANDLSFVAGWEEGRSISDVSIAKNGKPCADPNFCPGQNDEVQAWNVAINPEVAAETNTGGFLVVWQSNNAAMGCKDKIDRATQSIYGRFVDAAYDPQTLYALPLNPAYYPLIPIFRDQGLTAFLGNSALGCPSGQKALGAKKPRLAYHSPQNAFQVVYEVAAAIFPDKSDIGRKKVIAQNQTVTPALQDPGYQTAAVPDPSGAPFFKNPDLASSGEDVVLVYNDGTQGHDRGSLYAKKLNVEPKAGEGVNVPSLGLTDISSERGNGTFQPRLLSNGERLFLAYLQYLNAWSDEVHGLFLDPISLNPSPYLNPPKLPLALVRESAISSGYFAGYLNDDLTIATDGNFFLVADTAVSPVSLSNAIFQTRIASGNLPPAPPVLATEPAHQSTWAPTRLYLSWTPPTDPENDAITYNVYFSKLLLYNPTIPVVPEDFLTDALVYRSNLASDHFIIQASTDSRSEFDPDVNIPPVFLEPLKNYAWRICARDAVNDEVCGPTRLFHTDDSVMAWYRFDDNPSAAVPEPFCTTQVSPETVCDYSGKQNHGIWNGNPVWVVPEPALLGRALNFDGIDDWVEVPSSPTLNVTPEGISASCRLKTQPPPFAVTAEIFSRHLPNSGPYTMSVIAPNQIDFQIYGAGNNCPDGLPADDWCIIYSDITSVAGLYFRNTGVYLNAPDGGQDPSWIGIYLNDQLQDFYEISNQFAPTNHANPMKIGRGFDNNLFFPGRIDECLLFNRPLPAEEVKNLSKSDE